MTETIMLDRNALSNLFEKCNHQADVMIGIYKMVIPDWDNIKKLLGWPTVNNTTWKWICEKFIAFDHKHHPDVMAGGCWMNSGFSIENRDLLDFEVEPIDPTKIVYKGEKNRVTYISLFEDEGFRNVQVCRRINSHSYYRVSSVSRLRLLKVLRQSTMTDAYYQDDCIRVAWKE